MNLKQIRTKYKHLNPNYQPPSRRDLVDYDYLEKLSEEELAFLNKFTAENVSANFTDFPESRLVTKQITKEAFANNYARNSDIMIQSRSSKTLEDLHQNQISYKNDTLDTLCTLLDKFRFHPTKFKKND